jgi:hypothetical protein
LQGVVLGDDVGHRKVQRGPDALRDELLHLRGLGAVEGVHLGDLVDPAALDHFGRIARADLERLRERAELVSRQLEMPFDLK